MINKKELLKSNQRIILSGLQPTGVVHIGNYFGAIKQFVDMSRDPSSKCMFFIADLHSLTTGFNVKNFKNMKNSMQNNILTTALLKQFGVPRIVARASTDLHARILKIIGADEVVNPEKEMGMRTAQKVATPGLTELIPLSENAALAELKVPESFIGKN